MIALLFVLAYDPLHIANVQPTTMDFSVHDAARSRDIPVRIYLPAEDLPADKSPAPVVLYSHGLGGSKATSAFLGTHWAERGYVAVFVQHPGSDEAVWQGKSGRDAMQALRGAANVENFLERVQDIPAVLDALTKWNAQKDHVLFGRMDLSRVGMSGHSFGGITTQALSGQKTATGRSFTDTRIKAAIVFSPSTPRMGDAETAFAGVKIPWLLMTGTKDDSPIGDMTAEKRTQVFTALPAGKKYQLVLFGAEHSVFTDRALPNDKAPRNPKHHVEILALTTAFWDAYLRDDKDARAWLDGDGAKKALDAQDQWEKK